MGSMEGRSMKKIKEKYREKLDKFMEDLLEKLEESKAMHKKKRLKRWAARNVQTAVGPYIKIMTPEFYLLNDKKTIKKEAYRLFRQMEKQRDEYVKEQQLLIKQQEQNC